MAMPPLKDLKDSFLDLERHRRQLEDSAEKLRRSLQEWRLWEAEYEALREEVASAGRQDLARIRRDFDGQLVTSKEVVEIFGRADIKSSQQITNQLDRRLDYVRRNIETLEKKVAEAENKAGAAAVISNPDVRDEDGLPITEIVEQLDDEDNVVSYRLQVPSDAQPQVIEALEKAGITFPAQDDESAQPKAPRDGNHREERRSGGSAAAVATAASEAVLESSVSPTGPSNSVTTGAGIKKTVSFAEDTKGAPESLTAASARITSQAQILEQIMKSAREQEAMVSEPAILPNHESPEDAELRREMLKYGMSEIGPVVAELELEESYSDYGDDDESYDYFGRGDYDVDDDDDDEDGDVDGRSNSFLTDEYRQRMLELEKKLGVSSSLSRQDSRKTQEGVASEKQDIGDGPRVGRVSVDSQRSVDPQPPQVDLSPATKSLEAKPKPLHIPAKNKVRFADTLDVADESHPTAPPFTKSRIQGEHNLKSRSTVPPKGPAQAPPRFLDQEPPTAPSGPEGQAIADSVVEREPVLVPKEPGEFDAALLHQEIAVEHQRVRNKFIQKQGGYLKEDASAVMPLDESGGGQKRVSRFKAARLSRQ